jgi:hypothetical protein
MVDPWLAPPEFASNTAGASSHEDEGIAKPLDGAALRINAGSIRPLMGP